MARSMAPRDGWLVVGISGVTCGGKTTLAERLVRGVRGARALHQDRYFLPDAHPAHRPAPGLAAHHNHYDVLSALDMPQMYSDAVSTIEGLDKSHTRSEDVQSEDREGKGQEGFRLRLEGGKKLLVLEGFTALNYRPLFDLCDLRYYLVLEYGECLRRRALRRYSPPDVPGYFESAVWPAHLAYRAEMEREPAVKFLDGAAPREAALRAVRADLRRRGARDD